MSESKLTKVWDFVERYYPNYTSSSAIAINNDLQKLLDEENSEGDCASELLETLEVDYPSLGGSWDERHDTLTRLKNESDAAIYQAAIEGFIKSQED